MKKIFLYLFVGALAVSSCRKDDDIPAPEPEPELQVQNSYDDSAAVNFLKEHYFDERGNIKTFSETDSLDDDNTRLFDLEHTTLPSGVIYIIRDSVQPDPGKTIAETDSLKIMMNAMSYIASKASDGRIIFSAGFSLANTITEGGGVPIVDPLYYYIRSEKLNEFNELNETDFERDFFEIEGFREGLLNFKSFDLPDDANYNLQGIIIVPSRAAYGRDENIYGNVYRNRSFIFNFQLYNAYLGTP
ncbi:MAG: hypothetical protein LBE36_01580 [Flavobacteriaceae bacterium]|jgi:hypothetical protein|nr:hypothetical protein [Flavobacteriaceae bacterium]